jgi:thymidine kinase
MLTLIIGPMKCGKSLELIARAEPFKYAGRDVCYIKPKRDVRTSTVASRIGIETEALELDSLQDAPPSDVYAVDEAHMFDFYDAEEIKLWLRRGKEVIIAGLNTDHAGHLMQLSLKSWNSHLKPSLTSRPSARSVREVPPTPRL